MEETTVGVNVGFRLIALILGGIVVLGGLFALIYWLLGKSDDDSSK